MTPALVLRRSRKARTSWTAGAASPAEPRKASGPAAGASSYANTEIGQVVAVAYLDAFSKLVTDVNGMTLDAKADNVQQSVTMAKPGKLYEKADNKSKVIRDLDAGTTLYPTGEKDKIWWKVSDELGNEGWVPSPLLQLAK